MKQYKIIFGIGFDKDGNNLESRDVISVVDYAASKLTKIYGGVTREHHIGSWKDEQGRVVHEYVKSLVVIDTERKGDVDIKAVAQFIKMALKQSSVLIVTENVGAEFI